MKKLVRYLRNTLIICMLMYLVLLIPATESSVPGAALGTSAFSWKRDAEWKMLEAQFSGYRQGTGLAFDSIFMAEQSVFENRKSLMISGSRAATDPLWDSLLSSYLRLAPMIAVSPSRYKWYSTSFAETREWIKKSSRAWDVRDVRVKSAMYKVLYGMRSALEEVALQMPPGIVPDLLTGTHEPSVTDSARIFGVTVHSGDILLSRGGADVSAFIARGNDFPGNFSHIALLYVDSVSHQPYLVEAHIEKGVALSTVADYVADTKRRFMVLRIRSGLPAVVKDPWLSHHAAGHMYEAAVKRHIPYDFRLDFSDSTSMFCSEVASNAYASQGIQAWQNPSSISSPGMRSWLHEFGVDHFTTQMPSDLEYDPQFTVVAEWRDMETLYLDHIDNAVMDAWYESADKGAQIGYNRWKLPLARIIKAYCMILNQAGRTGLIPEGMTATQALRNEQFSMMHQSVKETVKTEAKQYLIKHGYRAPYWVLLDMARSETQKRAFASQHKEP